MGMAVCHLNFNDTNAPDSSMHFSLRFLIIWKCNLDCHG